MRYLIDIGHPAHVHYFRNLANTLTAKGHKVVFTCRDKDVTVSLLELYKFSFVCLGRSYKSLPGKIWGLFYYTLRILLFSFSFRPDMLLNATFNAAFAAWIIRKPHISLEDTFNMEQVRLYLPFTSCILTGDYEHPRLGNKEIRYAGYQELLYLHPNCFTADSSVLKSLGLKPGAKYVLIRFVSWTASHDIRHRGISYSNKLRIVKEFSKYAQVFISSESRLPKSLEKYQLKIDPHRMHDFMAFASLVFGESATMATEGAMLGTPGIFIDDTGRYYTRDLEMNYNLIYNYNASEEEQEKAINKGIDVLNSDTKGTMWEKKQKTMLSAKIDVSEFLVWFIENWPESYREMSENPEIQNKFY